MLLRKLILSLALAGLVAGQASAQTRGSDSDQEACTPDVLRLCQDYIPDETAIVACLKARGPQLSGACHAVMYRGEPVAPAVRQAESVAPSKHRRHSRHHRSRQIPQ